MRLGIGARITAVFGVGALLLSILMGGLSYFTTRHFLLAGRETAAQRQAFANASVVRSSLESNDHQYVTLLANIDAGSDAHSVLFHQGKPYASSLAVSASSIPQALRREVVAGNAATQTYRTADGTAEIAVGVPVPSVQAYYFEFFDLSDLDHTLRVLGITLFVAGIVTTVLGTALGRFASSRLLRPLADVSRAAGAIAGGELDTRLDPDATDPDLEGLTNSFNAMVDQLQVRIEREARFNSDVSHELRSPLTTLAASLEVLEAEQDHLPPRSRQALALLGDDLRRFQRMVSDLLEMSRVDAGSSDVFLEEVDVAELVQRSVEAGARSLDGHAGATPVGPHRPCRAGLPRRGRQAALRTGHGEPHGERGELRGWRPGDRGGALRATKQVVVTVDDAGPGIDPAERTKVFERFYRGSASGRRGTGTGSGLGLALVSEHMRLMGGSVSVDTSPQGGARIVLHLPVLDGAEPEDGDA